MSGTFTGRKTGSWTASRSCGNRPDKHRALPVPRAQLRRKRVPHPQGLRLRFLRFGRRANKGRSAREKIPRNPYTLFKNFSRNFVFPIDINAYYAYNVIMKEKDT